MPRQKKQHLKRRKDGRFRLIYEGQTFYSKPGGDEEECFAQKEEYIRQKAANGYYRQKQTVAQFAMRWMPIAHPDISSVTYNGLAIHMDKLLKHIGAMWLDDVKPLQIKEIYSIEYCCLSKSYISAAAQLYRAMFDAAVSEGLCKRNPAREKSAAPHKGTEGTHRAITAQEREWITTLCKDHRAHAAAMAMLYAGLRPPEAKALNIDRSIDFEAGKITLVDFAHMDGPYRYKITDEGKTKKARREIPLFSPLRQTLEGKHGMLITCANGTRVNKESWKCVWASYKSSMETAINGIQKRWYGRTIEQKKLKQEGKLPPWVEFTVVPYDLRHSFCTMCRDNGVELNTCVQWMGHKDARMVLKIYDEVSSDRSKNEAKKMENALIQGQNQGQTIL